MAFEKIYLVAKIEADIQTTAAGAITVQSDIPGNALLPRASVTVPVCARRVVAKRLPYNLQGKLFSFSFYAPGGTSRLYGMRVWARELPTGTWQWYALPVVDTPDGWSSVKIEIPQTGDWSSVRMDIPSTPEEWRGMKIEIPATSEAWGETSMPIKPTPPVPDWVSLEIDR